MNEPVTDADALMCKDRRDIQEHGGYLHIWAFGENCVVQSIGRLPENFMVLFHIIETFMERLQICRG